MIPKLLTIREASEYLNIEYNTFRHCVARRHIKRNGQIIPIPIVQFSRKAIRLDKVDLDRLIERLKINPMERMKNAV